MDNVSRRPCIAGSKGHLSGRLARPWPPPWTRDLPPPLRRPIAPAATPCASAAGPPRAAAARARRLGLKHSRSTRGPGVRSRGPPDEAVCTGLRSHGRTGRTVPPRQMVPTSPSARTSTTVSRIASVPSVEPYWSAAYDPQRRPRHYLPGKPSLPSSSTSNRFQRANRQPAIDQALPVRVLYPPIVFQARPYPVAVIATFRFIRD